MLDQHGGGADRSLDSPGQQLVEDEAAGYPSPAAQPGQFDDTATPYGGAKFGARTSFRGTSHSTPSSVPLYRDPSTDCRYRCLAPVLPHLRGIIPASVACDLLDVYLTEPGTSLFKTASPYILTRIFRKKSLLHPTNPRPTTPALLATMLWCSAQTADIVFLHVPGSRSRITHALYALATSLVAERDPDRWRRVHGGPGVAHDAEASTASRAGGYTAAAQQALPTTTATNEPAGVIDDVLTFILLSIAVSGGDFKSDCLKWWSKAVRLALALRLNREDERCVASESPCANPLCICRREIDPSVLGQEAREERRRVFWLVFCLDRHLALSFNAVLWVPDSYCEIYCKSCH
jgi:xylanolytic transcriptional activator XlnR